MYDVSLGVRMYDVYIQCVYVVSGMMCVWKLGDKVRDLRYDKVIGHVKSENIFHVGIQGQC